MVQNAVALACQSRLARIISQSWKRIKWIPWLRIQVRNFVVSWWIGWPKDYFFHEIKTRVRFLVAHQVALSLPPSLARAIKDMIDGSLVWIFQLIGQLDGKHVGGLHSCRCAGGRPQGRGSRRGYFNYRRWVYFAFGFSTQLSIARGINCLQA